MLKKSNVEQYRDVGEKLIVGIEALIVFTGAISLICAAYKIIVQDTPEERSKR